MTFYADLHIHSKYSRATSKHCDLEHLALWARKKGITVVGTGDFTHPAWLAELKDKLIPAEPGLFRLRPEQERAVADRLPRACHGPTRFLLSVEISTIYKKGERTRKIHHLIYVPDFASAERVIASLAKIGNLAADGRPILGLDARHLLEIVLQAGAAAYLVPAHIWTPWFAALGSKSGFDTVDECYADLAPHIFAVETGLSSDPPMNWRVSSLDRFRLVSNSDAHSPEKLGREACVFSTDVDYFAIRQALETGKGYTGTVEFFPEEGKYHLDGHRSCNLCFSPQQTRVAHGQCPVCKKPVTVGVMHRVEELADRVEALPPATAGHVQNLVPLPEILSEIYQTGTKSKNVAQHYERLLGQLGPELVLLNEMPLDDIRHAASALLAEAVSRLRHAQVMREAGFDGVYGTIRLFHPDELRQHTVGTSLFAEATSTPLHTKETASAVPAVPAAAEAWHDGDARETLAAQDTVPRHAARPGDVLAELDEEQRQAAEVDTGSLLIVAGPGSGKTKTLTHRIAHLIRHHGVPAAHCLAITFTRRAVDELRERLRLLLPDVWEQIAIFTFHALALSILQERWNAAGVQRGFRVAVETERLHLLRQALGVSASQARGLLSVISRAKRTRTPPEDAKHIQVFDAYQRELESRNLVDVDDLLGLAVDALDTDADLQAAYQRRYSWICIDEYQDVDAQQVRLIKQLVPVHGSVCAIGDPDQAIYGFRGADIRFFTRFPEDFPQAQVVQLRRNYRSNRTIVDASSQVMARSGSHQQGIAVRLDDPRPIVLYEAPSERAEAEFVVQTIEQMLGGHSFFSLDSGRSLHGVGSDLSFADFAVLYRTEAQAPALVEALARSGMPFQKRSHDRLMDHAGVVALTDALIAAQGTGSLREQLEAMLTSEHATAAWAEALDLLKPVAEACGADLERFLAQLAIGTQVDTWDPRADRISLLTLHAAKGLEFPVVFMVGCEAGILPLTWGTAHEADLDEERRLFYVGMTRAKNQLLLSHAHKRLWRGKVQNLALSPYVHDIEARLFDRQHARMYGHARPRDTQLKLF